MSKTEAPEKTAVGDDLMPKVDDLLVDRYYISRLVGRGGFSAVYEATDIRASGQVAVKVLLPEKSADPDLVVRFRQEVTLVRQLEHPNTIKVYDIGTTETGCLFMVSEFLDGVTIDEVINQAGQLAPRRVYGILEQTLRSLAEAHTKGIVHRDLKPSNIMLVRMPSEKDFVKVLDFGIAKALEPSLNQFDTKTGLVFCTPKYAAPELLRGREVKPATDVYSLGLIALEMLIGAAVVPTDSDAEAIAYQISPQPIMIPDELARTPLGVVIMRATSKASVSRYANAGEMLETLRQIDRGQLRKGPISTLIGTRPPTGGGAAEIDSAKFVRTPSGTDTKTLKRTPTPMPVSEAADDDWDTKTPPCAVPMGVSTDESWADSQPVPTPQQAYPLSVSAPPTVEQAPVAAAAPAVDKGKRSSAGLFVVLFLLVAVAAVVYFFATSGVQEPEVTPTPGEGSGVAGDGSGQSVVDLLPDEVDEPIGLTEDGPRGPDTRTLLRARMAASDHVLASWIPEDDVAPEMIESDDPTEQPVDTTPTDVVVERSEERGERLAHLYESAQVNEQALTLLRSALFAGEVAESNRSQAVDGLTRLYQSMINILLDLDRCGAAENRLEGAVAEAAEMALTDRVAPRLESMRGQIEECRERVALGRQRWDSSVYLARVEWADSLYQRAQALPPDDVELRRRFLYQSIDARQQAMEMLEAALEADVLNENQADNARQDLVTLNDLVLSTFLELDLSVAVAVELEELLSDPSHLSDPDTVELANLQQQMSVENVELLAVPLTISTPSEENVGLGTGVGTGLAAEPVAEVIIGETPWTSGTIDGLVGWMTEMAENTPPPVPVQPANDPTVLPFDTLFPEGLPILGPPSELPPGELGDVEGQEDVAALEPPPESDVLESEEDEELEEEEDEELEEEDEEPTIYRVRVVINTEPAGASVEIDGHEVGFTPFDDVIESEASSIDVRLDRDQYRSRTLVLSLDDGDIEETIELESVFGTVDLLHSPDGGDDDQTEHQ